MDEGILNAITIKDGEYNIFETRERLISEYESLDLLLDEERELWYRICKINGEICCKYGHRLLSNVDRDNTYTCLICGKVIDKMTNYDVIVDGETINPKRRIYNYKSLKNKKYNR